MNEREALATRLLSAIQWLESGCCEPLESAKELRAIHAALASAPAAPQAEPVGEVVMSAAPAGVSPSWRPHKIVSTTLAWIDSVPVGTKLYAAPPPQATIDRGDAVNLARNILADQKFKGVTEKGVRVLAESVMAMDAALTTPQATAPAGVEQAWVHKKSGGRYRAIGKALVQSDEPLTDLSSVVVYQGEDGGMWARSASEFRERFLPTGPSQAPAGVESDIMFPNVDGACNCVLYPNGETKPCAVCDPKPAGVEAAQQGQTAAEPRMPR